MDKVWEMILQNLPTIISLILGIGAIALYATKLANLLKQIAELMMAGHDLMNGATPEEIAKLKQEYKDVTDALKKLLGK